VKKVKRYYVLLAFSNSNNYQENEVYDKDTIFLLGNNLSIHHFNGSKSANTLCSGYRIITASAPGMTAANAFH